jgi:hypothetical protein
MRDRWKMGRRATFGIAAGVAVVLAAPALASADSNGFSIVNRTGSTVRLTQISASPTQPYETLDGIARRPLVGLTLAPNGSPLDVELVIRHRYAEPAIWTELHFVDGQGTDFTVRLKSETFVYRGNDIAEGQATCSVSANSLSQCNVDTAAQIGHPVVTLLDPPGTARTVPATDAQRQFRVLWDLCQDGGPTHCSFEADAADPISTYAPATVIGQPILNCGDKPITVNYIEDHTAYSSTSIGITVGVSVKVTDVFNTVEGKLSATAGHTWGFSQTFKETRRIPVLPRHIAYVSLTLPITRQYGTFTAEINNTTWTLPNVSFDTPDPGHPGARPDVIRNEPATSGQLAACDTSTGTLKVRPSQVTPS